MRARLALLTSVVCMLACEPSNPTPAPTPERLADDQTLSFPIAQDLGDLDPALISSAGDIDILRNVFSGLFKFDDKLRELPDLAEGPPSLSADGREYTFRIKPAARFSNGDPVTAADVRYSWNRAAATQGDYAGLLSIVKSSTALDAQTLRVTLVRPASYFLALTSLPPFWVVDQRVVASVGDPALVGSGPFRLTARTPGQSMDFEPVPDWYGGSTGTLTHVHIQVVADTANQLSQYEAGVFSLIGYGRQSLSTAGANRYAADPKLAHQLELVPEASTFWVGFNLKTGPFTGVDKGRAGRHAFSTAVDRRALEEAVCNLKTSCVAATGGVLSKGLAGYLGDDTDKNARFDAQAAKTEYQAWDPTGAKVKNLAYTYDSNPFNKAVCANLQQQWKANLGVTVRCVETDRNNFFAQRNTRCAYPMFRQSWAADYDHPQDWYAYLFVTGAPSSGSCYSNSSFDKLVRDADASTSAPDMAAYIEAGKMLVDDSIYASLLYGVQQYLVQPWVNGAGGNALYDNSWTSVHIVAHD